MAFYSIKPKYQDWIKNINKDNIHYAINDLNSQFNNITHEILYKEKTDKDIYNDVADIRKKLLYLQLASNMILHITNKDLIEKINNMNDNMILINKYEERTILMNQKRNINIITYITIIFLPLALITSYFGMNFYSMGASNIRRGVFGLNYGQLFVLVLCLVSVIATTMILRIFDKQDFTQ